MMNYTTAMSHNKDVWLQNVILNNKKVVDEFLRNKVRFEVFSPNAHDAASEAVQQYKQMKASILNQIKLAPEHFNTIAFANWTCPNMAVGRTQNSQVQLLNYILSEDTHTTLGCA